MYYGRHAKKESLFSIIVGFLCTVGFVAMVITALFGSWDLFVLKMIEQVPFGEAIFKTIANFLQGGNQFLSGGYQLTLGNIWNDCMKLLVAAVILPIVRYFAGYVYVARHAAKPSLFSRIADFFVDKVLLSVIVALAASWIVEWLSNQIWSIGGLISWILSIAGSLTAIGVSVWVFCTLAATTVWWGIAYMMTKVIPAAVSAMLSYSIMFLVMILISSPQYMSALGPVIILLIVCVMLINIADGMFEGFFKGTNRNKSLDWISD